MQRLLVAVDGSASARRALRHAEHLARHLRAQLQLINVQPTMPLIGVVRATMDADHYHAACAKLARKAFGAAARRHATHVRYGEPGTELAAAARELKCSGIVMGTRGHGAAANLVLGSVATKVVHHASVPVTLVK